jgi:hypothetical protein
MWVKPIEHGLHRCMQCSQIVTGKDIHPKLEDLPLEFQQRWEAHEHEGQSPAPTHS